MSTGLTSGWSHQGGYIVVLAHSAKLTHRDIPEGADFDPNNKRVRITRGAVVSKGESVECFIGEAREPLDWPISDIQGILNMRGATIWLNPERQ